MNFKENVYRQYVSVLNDKINALQQTLNELGECAKHETKSTAGDKHETALAMLQIEQENTYVKLRDALEQKTQLDRIDLSLNSPLIAKGSIIKTDKGFFFLSIALGKATIEGIPVIAISPQSPLGAKFIGLKENDSVEMNGIVYHVESID